MNYKLMIGNRVYSSWSLRAWMLMQAFDRDFEHQLFPMYQPEFKAFTDAHYPALQVPTLVVEHDGTSTPIWDSMAIVEFLAEQHPNDHYWPTDLAGRAAARSLCAEMHSGLNALRATMPMNLRKDFPDFEPTDAAWKSIRRMTDLWRWAKENWGGDGPYLFGQHFGAVDAFFVPAATRMRTHGIKLEADAQAYVDALLSHPTFVEWLDASRVETWIVPSDEIEMMDT